MRKFLLTAVAATLLAAPLLPGRAEAAPLAAAGVQVVIPDLNVVDNVAFIYRGHRHCWYANGWHGAGWYRCGFRNRRGFGWGGPAGWMGWAAPGAPVVVVKPRPRHRAPVIVIRP